jgi:H+-translocating NAD(P) transhydrogenase subunit alpha
MTSINTLNNPYVAILTIFILACFVGYYVVWKVTPALHTPLMSLTNAISSIIILGALIATGSQLGGGIITVFGGIAIFITAINIFGGFVVTQRMLRMYKKSH